MPTHAEGEAFEEDRAWFFSDGFGKRFYCGVRFKNIVAIYLHSFYSITYSFINKLLHSELLPGRSRETITVILYNEDDRQVPDSSYVYSFVEIAFAGGAIAGKNHCCFFIFF